MIEYFVALTCLLSLLPYTHKNRFILTLKSCTCADTQTKNLETTTRKNSKERYASTKCPWIFLSYNLHICIHFRIFYAFHLPLFSQVSTCSGTRALTSWAKRWNGTMAGNSATGRQSTTDSTTICIAKTGMDYFGE